MMLCGNLGHYGLGYETTLMIQSSVTVYYL